MKLKVSETRLPEGQWFEDESHLSNENRAPGCLGDEILPSYIGIIISQYKDPYQPTRMQWKVRPFFSCDFS